MSNPEREKEKQLLKKWFDRISFTGPSPKDLPKVKKERGDDA